MPHAPRTALIALTAALTLLSVGTSPAAAERRKPQCKSGVQWTRMRTGFVPAFTRPLENRTSETATQTVVVSRSRTVERKLSASLESEVKGGFIVEASVKAQFGAEVQSSVSTKTGVTGTFKVRPFYRVNVRYGTFTKVLTGMLLGARDGVVGPPAFKGCGLTRLGTVSATLPQVANEGFRASERKLRRP